MQRNILFLLLTGFYGLVAMNCSNADDTPTPDSTARVVAYDTVVARVHPGTGSLQVNVELMPNEKFVIVSKVNGLARKVSVDSGQQVTSGYTLATIDASDISVQLASANNEARLAVSRVEQSKQQYNQLLSSRSASATELQKARVQMNASLQAYKAALAVRRSYVALGGKLLIRSPFRGVVAGKNVHTGDSIFNDDEMLFELEDHQMLRLHVPVPEVYADAEIRDNQATFTASGFGSTTFQANYIGKFVDAGNIKNEVWVFEVDNNNRRLKTGLAVRVQLSLQAPAAGIMVPNTAILTSDDKTFVIRVVDNKATWVEVTKGATNGEETEIVGPVAAGEIFIRNASAGIENGSPITIR
jgi:membrane fusion protein, multidrug efflux system